MKGIKVEGNGRPQQQHCHVDVLRRCAIAILHGYLTDPNFHRYFGGMRAYPIDPDDESINTLGCRECPIFETMRQAINLPPNKHIDIPSGETAEQIAANGLHYYFTEV